MTLSRRIASVAMICSAALSGMGVSAQQSDQRVLNEQLVNAVAHGDTAAASRLIQQGASVEAAHQDGTTALMIAADDGDVAMTKMLLGNGANVRAKDKQGWTAPTHAALSGSFEVTKVFLQKGLTPRAKDQALFAAIDEYPVIIEAPPDTAPTPGSRVLHPPSPWLRTAKLLLDNGADVEARNRYGETPLIAAALHAHADIVKLMLKKGANVEDSDDRGETALIAAACNCASATMNSAYDAVKALLEYGADVNARSQDGTTALMAAARGPGNVDTLKLLLDAGADATAKDNHGNTALSLAKKAHRPEKVQLLAAAMRKTPRN